MVINTASMRESGYGVAAATQMAKWRMLQSEESGGVIENTPAAKI